MADIQNLGYVVLELGIFVLVVESRSRGKMKIQLGEFEGPVWFLMFVIGIGLIGFGYL